MPEWFSELLDINPKLTELASKIKDRLTANAVAALLAMEIFPIKVINISKGQAYVNYGPPSVEK